MLHGRASARGEVHIIAAPQHWIPGLFTRGPGRLALLFLDPGSGLSWGVWAGSERQERIASQQQRRGVAGLQGRDAADRYTPTPRKGGEGGLFFRISERYLHSALAAVGNIALAEWGSSAFCLWDTPTKTAQSGDGRRGGSWNAGGCPGW